MAVLTKASKAKIRSFLGRLEEIAEERKDLKDREKEIYQEVSDAGLSAKTMRRAVKIALKDPEVLKLEHAETDRYLEAMGKTPIEELIEQGKKSDSNQGRGRGRKKGESSEDASNGAAAGAPH